MLGWCVLGGWIDWKRYVEGRTSGGGRRALRRGDFERRSLIDFMKLAGQRCGVSVCCQCSIENSNRGTQEIENSDKWWFCRLIRSNYGRLTQGQLIGSELTCSEFGTKETAFQVLIKESNEGIGDGDELMLDSLIDHPPACHGRLHCVCEERKKQRPRNVKEEKKDATLVK